MNGPGSPIGGLAPPQDNPPANPSTGWPAPPKTIPHTSPVDGGPTPQGVDQADDLNPDPGSGEGITAETPTGLVGYIASAWARNRRAREQGIDHRLLACLRARRGEYDAAELSSMWTSTSGAGQQIYLALTAMKQRAAEAAFRDLLLPYGERPWGIDPSPLPDLSPADLEPLLEQAAQAAEDAMKAPQEAVQQGQPPPSQAEFKLDVQHRLEMIRAQVIEARKRDAKAKCALMEDAVSDVMEQGGYYDAIAEFIQNFCTFPTSILKGPFKTMKKRLKWVDNKPVVSLVPVNFWAAPSPLDCYPSPGSRTAQDGDFIERLRLERADLFEMIGLPGYNEGAIRRVLQYHMGGGLQGWLQIDAERSHLEGQAQDTWLPTDQIDALHYWGSVQGCDLLMNGIAEGVDDPLGYYEVDAILVGNEVIRCELNSDPLGERPYWSASYDHVPGAFWGNAIYELMKDCQAMVNSCARSIDANMGLSSGPIIGIDMAQLAVGQDPKALRPLQLIQLDRSRTQTPRDPLTFYQADSQIAPLLTLMKAFEDRADELTGIPRYAEGDSHATGAATTLGGLSILMNASARGLRRAVSNIDRGVVSKTVTKVYQDLMVYSPDESIKGDASVVARGAAAAIIKEQLQQTRSQFLTSVLSSPKLMQILGDERIANLARTVVDTLDLPADDVVPTEAEMKQRVEAEQQQPPPQPDPNHQLQAQVDREGLQSKERVAGNNAALKLVEEHMIHPKVKLPETGPGVPAPEAADPFSSPTPPIAPGAP